MLVLNRRIGEAVMIAEDITVTVLGVKGTQVRLGLAAPSTVPIHREEIFKRIQREQASRGSPRQPRRMGKISLLKLRGRHETQR